MRPTPAGNRPRLARWVGPAVVLLFPLCLVGKGLLPGRVLAPLDALLLMDPWKQEVAPEFRDFREVQTPLLDCVTQYYPWRVYARDCLQAGEIPLWSPYAFCGTPFVANQQSAVFYPPNVLFWVMPLRWAYGLSAYLALVLCGTFCWALCRELGISVTGAALAVVGFVSCGYVTAWLCYMGPVNSFLWAPGGLWLITRYTRLHDVWSLVGLTACSALTLLGGHAQAALYALALMAAYAVFASVSPSTLAPVGRASRLADLTRLGGALALGAALASIQVLPTLELTGLNYRTGGSDLPARGLQLGQLNILVAPQAHGNIAWRNELNSVLGYHNYVETCGYVVLAAVWAAVAGAVLGGDRRRWFFIGAAVAGLVLAVEGPHQTILRAVAPPLRQMANVGRAVCLWGLCVPVLAGFGLDALGGPQLADPRRRSRAVAAGLVALVLAALAISGSWTRLVVLEENLARSGDSTRMLAPITASLVWAAALVALCGAVTVARVRLRWSARLTGGLMLTLAFADAVLFAGGFQPAVPARLLSTVPPTVEWLSEQPGEPFRIAGLRGGGPFADYFANLPTLAGLRDVRGYDSLYPTTAAEVLGALDLEHPDGLWKGSRRTLLDRLGVRYIVTRNADRLAEHGLSVARPPFIAENPAAWPLAFASSDPTLPGEPPEPVNVRWATNARRIEPPTGQYVWLSETDYPGWRAYVGGRPAAIEPGGPGLKRVRADGLTVDLVYEPGSFAVGAFISCCALGVATAPVGWALARRRWRE